MKALTAAPLTCGAALPAYFATPSCRSISNHVSCRIIAFHHASVTRGFRTSPWYRRLVAALRRIEFALLRTNSSPPVALHLASRRRSYLRLRSLWLSPTRTFTVLMWRPHGRTIPAFAGMTEPPRCRWPDRILPAHVFSKEGTLVLLPRGTCR